MKEIRVNVTQKDINNGSHAAESCPVALAFRRAVPTLKRVLIGNGVRSSYLSRTGIDYTIHLPEKANRFIEAFDRFDDVKPFKFTAKITK